MSESVDRSLHTKNFVKIYNENETILTRIPYSFIFFSSSKCFKIARLAIQRNPIKPLIHGQINLIKFIESNKCDNV